MRITFEELRKKQEEEVEYPTICDAEDIKNYQTRLHAFLDKYGYTLDEYIEGLCDIILNKDLDKLI